MVDLAYHPSTLSLPSVIAGSEDGATSSLILSRVSSGPAVHEQLGVYPENMLRTPRRSGVHSPAQSMATRRVCAKDDDIGLFYCHFCQAPLVDIAQACPGCAFPHAGDGKYINVGTASDQSYAADVGHLVKGLTALTPPAGATNPHDHHGNGQNGNRGRSESEGSPSDRDFSDSSGAEFNGTNHALHPSPSAVHSEEGLTPLRQKRQQEPLRAHSSLNILNWTRVAPPAMDTSRDHSTRDNDARVVTITQSPSQELEPPAPPPGPVVLDFPVGAVAAHPQPQCSSTSMAIATAITSRLLQQQGFAGLSRDPQPIVVLPREIASTSAGVAITQPAQTHAETQGGNKSTGSSLAGSAELLARLGEAHRNYLATATSSSRPTTPVSAQAAYAYVQQPVPYARPHIVLVPAIPANQNGAQVTALARGGTHPDPDKFAMRDNSSTGTEQHIEEQECRQGGDDKFALWGGGGGKIANTKAWNRPRNVSTNQSDTAMMFEMD